MCIPVQWVHYLWLWEWNGKKCDGTGGVVGDYSSCWNDSSDDNDDNDDEDSDDDNDDNGIDDGDKHTVAADENYFKE